MPPQDRSLWKLVRWLPITDRCLQASITLWIVSWVEPRTWVGVPRGRRPPSGRRRELLFMIMSRARMELERQGCSRWLRWARDGWNRASGLYLAVAPCRRWPGLSTGELMQVSVRFVVNGWMGVSRLIVKWGPTSGSNTTTLQPFNLVAIAAAVNDCFRPSQNKPRITSRKKLALEL